MGGVQGTPLCEAVKNNDPNQLTRLLASGSDPNEGCDFDGAIALHYAAQNHVMPGITKMVRQLLKAGANPNARTTDSARMMPLHHAAQNGAHEIAVLLLNAGAKIDARENNGGRPPVVLAAAHGHIKFVNLLVERGADAFKMTKTGGHYAMPAMNALDAAIVGKNYHDRADEMIARASEMQKMQLMMSKQQQLGTTGDHAAVIKRLKALGLAPTPDVPTTADESDALIKKHGTGVKDVGQASNLERMQGTPSESAEAYERDKTRARDAVAAQRAESQVRGDYSSNVDAEGRDVAPDAVTCETCGAVAAPGAKLHACSRCRTTRYCSSLCQKAHWTTHKKYCKIIAAGK